MSIRRRRYQAGSWSIDIMDKPWFVDVLTYVLVGVWMAWTFATIQQYGPDPWLLASAVVVLAAGLLLIYNQRLAYLRIGDRVVLGTREAMEQDALEEPERRNK
jgi:hypothetical protein